MEMKKFSKEIEKEFKRVAFRSVYSADKTQFHSLIINYCNAGLNEEHAEKPWSFCDAVIGYGYRLPVAFCLWYGYLIEGICDTVSINDAQPNFFKAKGGLMMETISMMRDRHEKCLKQLLEEENLCEDTIKCILAIHYFQPLSKPGSNCYVDKNQGFKNCKICGKVVVADYKKTSFGNSIVWHGQADILIESASMASTVKVDIETVKESKDKRKTEGDQGKGCSEEKAENTTVNPGQVNKGKDQHKTGDWEKDCSTSVEVKTEDTKDKTGSHSQVLAQTIVNAFVESKRNRSLFGEFIPSFFATNKNIRIIMYNCELDKLLFSEELPIWHEGHLNISTMIFVLIELSNLKNNRYSEEVLEQLMTMIPKCGFKEAAGPGYAIYLDGVTRPCNETMQLDSHKQPFTNYIENHFDDPEMAEVAAYLKKVSMKVNAAIFPEK